MSPVSVPESRLGLTCPRRAVSLSPGWLLDTHTWLRAGTAAGSLPLTSGRTCQKPARGNAGWEALGSAARAEHPLWSRAELWQPTRRCREVRGCQPLYRHLSTAGSALRGTGLAQSHPDTLHCLNRPGYSTAGLNPK